MYWRRYFLSACSALCLLASQSTAAETTHTQWTVYQASYVSGGAGNQAVRGARIQSDGTIIIGIDGARIPAGLKVKALDRAKASDATVILRLAADGRSVLSATRLPGRLTDLALGRNDSIVIAAWDAGLYVLNADANRVLWSAKIRNALRVDAGSDGIIAALRTNAESPDTSTPSCDVMIWNTEKRSSRPVTVNGHRNTLDIAVNADTKTVGTIGWRQANANDANSGGRNPVQICYIRGATYKGKTLWTGYDWTTDAKQEDHLNKPTNNMADTRGYRITSYEDHFYCGFESAGGNHLFRYDPHDVDKDRSQLIVGGDAWHSFYNTKSEHKTFIGKYTAEQGDFVAGQQFVARHGKNGNAMRIGTGDIAVDATGRLFFSGASASGLPIQPSSAWDGANNGYTPQAGENPINRGNWNYMGGAFVMVMSPDLRHRALTLLAGRGSARAVAVRTLGKTSLPTVLIGGDIQLPPYSDGKFNSFKQNPFTLTNPLKGSTDFGKNGGNNDAFMLLLNPELPAK